MSTEDPAAPSPQPPYPSPRPPAPTGASTGDAEIEAQLGAMSATDPDDLDAQIAAGHRLHDLLRDRLADDS